MSTSDFLSSFSFSVCPLRCGAVCGFQVSKLQCLRPLSYDSLDCDHALKPLHAQVAGLCLAILQLVLAFLAAMGETP